MSRIALVTCRILPEPDPDQELLLSALRDEGHTAEMLPWDEPTSDPSAFDLCVLRSCWNYHRYPGSFLRWIGSTAESSRLLNPAAVVRWNHHKSYLRELQEAGIGIIPSVWFSRGEEVDLQNIMAKKKWDDVVVKPTVSAASFRTRRFAAGEKKAGTEYLRELLRDRDAMAQQYIPAVETEGEQAIVWVDGVFTHAVRKSPRFSGGAEQVSGGLPVPPEARAIGEKALASVREQLLYARVDVVRDGSGRFVLSELELIEPSLFLLQCRPALERLVKGISSRL